MHNTRGYFASSVIKYEQRARKNVEDRFTIEKRNCFSGIIAFSAAFSFKFEVNQFLQIKSFLHRMMLVFSH